MRVKEYFTVFARSLPSGRKVFYFQVYDEEGHRMPARSTGERTRSAARAHVANLIKTGDLVARPVLTFGKYAEGWWLWDRCAYIQRKLARGHSMSRGYADARRTYLDRHLLPYFEHMKLSAIKVRDIEA